MKSSHLLLLGLLLAVSAGAGASHYRGGTLSWDTDGDTVVIHGTGYARISAYGSEISEGTTFSLPSMNLGDSSTVPLNGLVTQTFPALDWFVFDLVDAATNQPVRHDYDGVGPYRVWFYDSARLGNDAIGGDGTETLQNNAGAGFQLETSVRLDAAPPDRLTRSPRTLALPIVPCLKDAVCEFTLPGISEGTGRFRFSTGNEAESGTFTQPDTSGKGGSAAAIDPVSGTYTWDTTGYQAPLIEDGARIFYSTQVMLVDEQGKTPVDFFIELVDSIDDAPYWTPETQAGVCDVVETREPGQQFDVTAVATIDTADEVFVDVLNAPPGAVITKVSGNPGSARLQWTPASTASDTIVVFVAYTAEGLQAPACTYTLDVQQNKPPVPWFDIDVGIGSIDHPVTFMDASTDPDGTVVAWAWDLDDDGTIDTTAQDPGPLSYPAEGSYPVTLRVTDDQGEQAAVTRYVVIDNSPPAAAFSGPAAVGPFEEAVFTDASIDPNDNIETIRWVLDGETAGSDETLALSFERSGLHQVCLEVTDARGLGDRACGQLRVTNMAPTVSIQVTPGTPEGSTAAEYQFVCLADDPDGTVQDCDWSFGDGDTARGVTVMHRFANKADDLYTVRVTATDDGGATATATAQVRIDDQAPYVRIDVYRDEGDADDVVRFASQSADLEGPIQAHAWDFGDGTTSARTLILHTFPDPEREYRVQLTVTDSRGAATSTSLVLRPADLLVVRDTDDDGIPDTQDVCPSTADPDQADTDGDGAGDACDGDRDGDGVDDTQDAFPDDPTESTDTDGDGIGDAADDDADGDGVSDEEEQRLGTDPTRSDGDGDGIPDADELADGTDPLDDTSPAWSATDLSLTDTPDGPRISWRAPDDRVQTFVVYVDGEPVLTVDNDGSGTYHALVPAGGAYRIDSLLADGRSDGGQVPLRAAADPPSDPAVWPWFLGGGLAVAGGLATVFWIRRR